MLAERADREVLKLSTTLGIAAATRVDKSGLDLLDCRIISPGLGIALLQHNTPAELREMAGREDPLASPEPKGLILESVDPLRLDERVQHQFNPNEISADPVLEDDRNNVLTEEVLKYRRIKEESAQAAPAVESLKTEVSRARRLPWTQLVPSDIVKGLATGGLAFALLIQALPLFQTGREAQAADQTDKSGADFWTPTPNLNLKIDGTPTTTPNNLLIPPAGLTPRSVEIQQLIQDSIDFYIGIKKYNWNFTNASYGINPPNNPSIGTGTVRVNIDGVYYQSEDAQPLQSLYPKPLLALGMGGMAVDIPLDKYYLGTGTFVGNNSINGLSMYATHLEAGIGVTTPYSYTGRIMVDNGLPIIYGNSSQYITLGRDVNSNYTNVFYDNAVDPTKNGTYQIRRDMYGAFIGNTFILLPASNKIFLPLVQK